VLKGKIIAESVKDWKKTRLEDVEKIKRGLQIMRMDGQPELAKKQYARVYAQVLSSARDFIFEKDIRPVETLPKIVDLPALEKEHYRKIGQAYLSALIKIKGNGGLATGMKLDKAKNLMEIKPGVTFLDAILQQTIRENTNLILFNSDNTDKDTKDYLSDKNYNFAYASFVQGRFPKLDQNLEPIYGWGDKGFNPSGTGGFYTSLLTERRINARGKMLALLDALISDGKEWLFFSNGDNLGATFDAVIFGYMIEQKLPFMMEVTKRTLNDVKGGHPVYTWFDGEWRLTLRDNVHISPNDIDPATGKTYGEDISRHKFFNTNNLWYHLPTLRRLLRKYDDVLPLSIVLNPKTIELSDGSESNVYQLETVIGTIIKLISGAGALVVDKERFAPVKKYDDLFLIGSDVYLLGEDGRLNINPRLHGRQLPIIRLDKKFFDNPKNYTARVDIKNMPSLVNSQSLNVKGDVYFGKNIKMIGKVRIENNTGRPQCVPDNETLVGTDEKVFGWDEHGNFSVSGF
jgi:UDP-N-acetylglucosamine pyrophosphorylase